PANEVRLRTTGYQLDASLSRRRLELRLDGRPLRAIPIAIGAAASPTPPGRYQVTDKLDGARYSAAAYGCCILALSGHQTHLRSGWTGGNRLAIHGGGGIGGAVSNGCLHASETDLRYLMRTVPL